MATAAAASGAEEPSDKAELAEATAEAAAERVRRLLFGYKCGFYPKKSPEEESLCMVKVRRVAEMGAYVDLVEYEDREGMVLLSELSRRRIRSIRKLIGEGKMEVVMVIRKSEVGDSIDLSKRRVDPDDRAAYEQRYNMAVQVQNTMRKIVKDTFDPDAHDSDFNPLRSICERLSWKLYEEYPHAMDGLNAIAGDHSLLDKYDLTDAEKKALLGQLAKKTRSVAEKVRTDVQVTCFGYEGVVAIREALSKAREASTDTFKISVTTLASPVYSLSTTVMDVPEGVARLNAANKAIKDCIESYGGSLVVVKEPSTMLEKEE